MCVCVRVLCGLFSTGAFVGFHHPWEPIKLYDTHTPAYIHMCTPLNHTHTHSLNTQTHTHLVLEERVWFHLNSLSCSNTNMLMMKSTSEISFTSSVLTLRTVVHHSCTCVHHECSQMMGYVLRFVSSVCCVSDCNGFVMCVRICTGSQ